jgi:DNA-nicking Smr family endonuclease
MRSQPEDEEFRQAMAGVAPLRTARRAIATTRRRPAVATERMRDERAALEESLSAPMSLDDAMDAAEELVYLREGMARDALRKLRRGHWAIEENLDLHGMNRVEAARTVEAFLRHCKVRRAGCIRIVHGKGLGSRNREPVLKGLVRNWLAMREEVLAFCQAPSVHGGSGAVLVLLKASPR